MDFNTLFLGNYLEEYIEALLVSVLIFATLWLTKGFALNFFKKRKNTTEKDIDRTLHQMVSHVKVWFSAAVALYVGSRFLSVAPQLAVVIERVFLVALVVQLIVLTSIFVRFFLLFRFSKDKNATTRSALEIIGNVATVVLWVLGFLFVLSNFGVEITSLIAGLGIGGLAVALALQGVLSDLFSSLAIYFDKPFQVGDFIEYNGQLGTVKNIGMKTTRIQLLRGEELVVTNKELSEGRVQNYNELVERRIATSFQVTHQTTIKNLERIPEMVRDIISSTESARFDRAHFSAIGDSAFHFDIVYYVESDAYAVYMDAQQKINLDILRAFEKEGIELAHPTQTLYVKDRA